MPTVSNAKPKNIYNIFLYLIFLMPFLIISSFTKRYTDHKSITNTAILETLSRPKYNATKSTNLKPSILLKNFFKAIPSLFKTCITPLLSVFIYLIVYNDFFINSINIAQNNSNFTKDCKNHLEKKLLYCIFLYLLVHKMKHSKP